MMGKRKIVFIAAFACVKLLGCVKAQKNVEITSTESEVTENTIEGTTSSGILEMATVSEKEYALQQLEGVQVTLLDSWTTDDPENYFVKYFSEQRKNREEENTDTSATTYVILMEYPEMDNEWKSSHLPELCPLKEDETTYSWTDQSVNYYGRNYGGKSTIVVCTVDEPCSEEKVPVQIKDSRFDDVFLDKEASKDQQKDFEYAKSVFSEPDALNYIKDRWYVTVNDWKSSSGSGNHEGKDYSYVNYTTAYAPISVGLDTVLTSADVTATVGCSYDTDIYSVQIYVNDPEYCDSMDVEYVTNITERIIQDEDAARQKYGEIDFDQTTKDWEEIRKMTVLSCQEQKF